MRPIFVRPLLGLLLASTSLTACLSDENMGDEDLGDIGDGKSDSFGIVDRSTYVNAGKTRSYTFSANAAFRLTITQPADVDQMLDVSITKPDGSKIDVGTGAEPGAVHDPADSGGNGTYTLTIKNTGTKRASLILNVRPLGGFGELPNPNASVFPDAMWQPPALGSWPASYVIFNNPGCGHTCTSAQSTEMAPRSVMVKMLVAAIHDVKQGGTIRVSNFNISSSSSTKPVVDALLWAMQNKAATVKVVMDEAQNNATSRTTLLSQQGAQVRFLDGIHYTNSVGAAVGIMHSKIVVVDDQIVFTGSNNFSSTGFIVNEENSVVLRAPGYSSRIAAFTCDIDKMFEIGVAAGQPQKTDAERRTAILALDQCNTDDVWFPPTGTLATGDSVAYGKVASAIYNSKKSLSIAPDMLAHPALVTSIVSRAKKAKTAGQPYSVKLVLDASDEALGNPAFGDCLSVAAQKYGLDLQVRYWRGTPEIYQLMHHKFMIVDQDDPAGAALYNGSANYSAKALKWSFENVTRYKGSELRQVVDSFTARFTKLFADAKDKAGMAADGHAVPNCPLATNSL
ncbi:MAG TPA: phospholipase D-like domain-containing protein [Kofleriaceae bacterium]|nr:phospholipase D-like domain-containing protein [Kofleriaceae bacterium]